MIEFLSFTKCPDFRCFICDSNLIGKDFGEVAWSIESVLPGMAVHFLVCVRCFYLLTNRKTKKQTEDRIRKRLAKEYKKIGKRGKKNGK